MPFWTRQIRKEEMWELLLHKWVFQNFISDNGLQEIKTNKGTFTWSNRRVGGDHITEKLDRFFWGGNWASKPLIFEARVKPIVASDHFPIELLICLDSALI